MRATRPADRDYLVFPRLAQHLEHPHPRLGHLIRQEHAPVAERDLARARPLPSAHEAG
jgi:hypothetical protein